MGKKRKFAAFKRTFLPWLTRIFYFCQTLRQSFPTYYQSWNYRNIAAIQLWKSFTDTIQNINKTKSLARTVVRVNVGSLFRLLKKINYYNYSEMTHRVYEWGNVSVRLSNLNWWFFLFSLSKFFTNQPTIITHLCCWFLNICFLFNSYSSRDDLTQYFSCRIQLRNMKLNIPFLIFSYFTSQSLGLNFHSEDKNIYVKNRYYCWVY